jgi:predicted signal transduction protein with EAL and GGDEF domain
LGEVGTRLGQQLRDHDTIARLGGDEFAVLLTRLPSPDYAAEVARRLLEALHEPFVVNDLSLVAEASIGITCYPEHADEVDTLLQRADVAMYAAKESRSGYLIYDPSYDHGSATGLTLLAELRGALEREEIVVHYQPKVGVPEGRVTGVEALVRWQHPVRGLVLPDEFIPATERTGLIQPLTRYVLERAIRQCRAWRDQGLDLTMAVNLSVRSLADSTFADELTEMLDRWPLPEGALVLEITERTLMSDPGRAVPVLSRLRELGVALSLDDYGTGYSSVAHLGKLPVEELKIDKSFVLRMQASESDAVIVHSTIELGHNLGLQVVAEGVETAAVWELLRRLGCDRVQGFLFSRAIPADEIPAAIADVDAHCARLSLPVRTS